MTALDNADFALEDSINAFLSLVILGVKKSELGVYYCVAHGGDKRLHIGKSIKLSFRGK